MAYEFIEHTADIRMRVSGKALTELFSSALSGMGDILFPGLYKEGMPLDTERNVSIVSADPTVLLIDFLSEVLTLSYEESVVFC
jgi:SHS2 domain-containing protein